MHGVVLVAMAATGPVGATITEQLTSIKSINFVKAHCMHKATRTHMHTHTGSWSIEEDIVPPLFLRGKG